MLVFVPFLDTISLERLERHADRATVDHAQAGVSYETTILGIFLPVFRGRKQPREPSNGHQNCHYQHI